MADSPTEAAPPALAATSPARSGSHTLMLGVIIALLAACLGALVVLIRRPDAPRAGGPARPASNGEKNGEPAKEPGHDATGPGGVTVRLPDFVVRLRNTDADRFARISFELEVAGDKDKEAVARHQPQIRDAFIAWLSDRSAEELRGSEGLQKAKQDLLARALEVAGDSHILKLYITDFVVQ